MRTTRWRKVVRALTSGVFLLAACSVNVRISVILDSSTLDLLPGEEHIFSALVEGSLDNSVTWSVAGPGTVGLDGRYVAPSTVGVARFATVRARSVTDPDKYSDCVVTILPRLAFGSGTRVTVDPVARVADVDFVGDEGVLLVLNGTTAGTVIRVPFSGAAHADAFAGGGLRSTPERMRTGSLDDDPFPDAVLAERGTGAGDGAIWIVRGTLDGTGIWEKAVTGGTWFDAAIEDVDGDGAADLVLLTAGTPGNGACGGRVAFGPDYLRVSNFLPSAGVCAAFATADFDLDASADLVLLDSTQNTLRVSRGLGANGFGEPAASVVVPIGNLGVAFAIADLDGDHAPDVVVGGTLDATTSQIATFIDGGALSLDPALTWTLTGRLVDLAVGDLEDDGRPDVVVALDSPPSIAVLRGRTGGGFADPVFLPLDDAPSGIAVGDATGDGLLDIVAGVDSAGGVVMITLRNTSS